MLFVLSLKEGNKMSPTELLKVIEENNLEIDNIKYETERGDIFVEWYVVYNNSPTYHCTCSGSLKDAVKEMAEFLTRG